MKNRLTNRFHMRYTRVNSIGWEQTWHRVSSNQVYRHHGYDYAVVSVFLPDTGVLGIEASAGLHPVIQVRLKPRLHFRIGA